MCAHSIHVCMCAGSMYICMYVCAYHVYVCMYILSLHSKHTSMNYEFSAVQQQFLPCGPRLVVRGSLNLDGKNITTICLLTCN
jgi:hypothetical protein